MILDERQEDSCSSDENESRIGMNIDNLGMDQDDNISSAAGKLNNSKYTVGFAYLVIRSIQ